MAVNYAEKYSQIVDERFKVGALTSALVNYAYDWVGVSTVKVFSVPTATMGDYKTDGANRYGTPAELENEVQEMILSKDRAFTFTIDKKSEDDTMGTMAAAAALRRQIDEVIIPEIDTYVYGVMCTKAGTKPTAAALTKTNIYTEILKASQTLDEAQVPETGRIIVVTPATYVLMKQCTDIVMETDIGNDMRLKGVIGMLDGCSVVKVPATRLPAKFGFMVAHPSATVAPTKLEDYKIHKDPPGISGSLVEGRICYDAFVLDNKTKAIYYQATT